MFEELLAEARLAEMQHEIARSRWLTEWRGDARQGRGTAEGGPYQGMPSPEPGRSKAGAEGRTWG